MHSLTQFTPIINCNHDIQNELEVTSFSNASCAFMATVPALHQPLTKLAYAVVLLLGRVMSERFRRDKGYVCKLSSVLYAYQCITC